MSTVMNKGVDIHSKSVTTQVFTVVGVIIDLDISLSKPKGTIYSSPSIRQPSSTVTSNSPVIYNPPSLAYSFLSVNFNLSYKM